VSGGAIFGFHEIFQAGRVRRCIRFDKAELFLDNFVNPN
jgi:uncharacterized protein with LGFP repeats